VAASDPTFGVATPTGVLEGVAAFGWDGSAWQPSGLAGPDVATPTGVLRGVAPFTWSGSAWTPTGRSQPGVATPTGVLDGVAVYTWSGSAWTPTGGQPHPSTPTGALKGVAAFSWDGAAWQPAGQAGPDVATPYGVLRGVAPFTWNGGAWTAVEAPARDINFLTTPGTLPTNVTLTRTGAAATYFDVAGTLQTAAANAPRWDYDPVTHALRGLLLEEARTNVLLNSAALGTQSVTVTAQAYTLSFYGSGTITLSGTSTAGPLTGTGAFPARVSLTFTPTAGSLTLTVTGSVLNAQLEAGAMVTSWISTTGAAATRGTDVCSMPVAGWFNAAASSLVADYMMPQSPNPAAANRDVCCLNDGTTTNRMGLRGLSNGGTAANPAFFSFVAAVQSPPAYLGVLAPLTVAKIGAAWDGANPVGCLNGGAPVSYAQGIATGITTLQFGNNTAGTSLVLNGWLRRVRYWPRALAASELRQVTT
jgi:hypothetical protein